MFHFFEVDQMMMAKTLFRRNSLAQNHLRDPRNRPSLENRLPNCQHPLPWGSPNTILATFLLSRCSAQPQCDNWRFQLAMHEKAD